LLVIVVVALVAGFRKNGHIMGRRGSRIAGGVLGLLVGFMTPFASIYFLMSVLSPEADCSRLIVCVQKPESAFILFVTYLALVVFGGYVGGLLSANTVLGLLTGLVAGTLGIPLAIVASLGRGDVLGLLYRTDVGIYILLGILGAASGAAAGRERARERTLI